MSFETFTAILCGEGVPNVFIPHDKLTRAAKALLEKLGRHSAYSEIDWPAPANGDIPQTCVIVRSGGGCVPETVTVNGVPHVDEEGSEDGADSNDEGSERHEPKKMD